MTRKPTATQRLDALLDDLRQAVTELRDKSDSYLRTAKAYSCRSNEPIKAGIVKGAAVLRMDADKIEAIIAKHESTNAQAVAEVAERTEAPSWPVAASEEPSDQDAVEDGSE